MRWHADGSRSRASGGGARSRAAIAEALRDSFADYRQNLGAPDAQEHGFYVRRFLDLMELQDDEGAQRERLREHLDWIETLGTWNREVGDRVVDIAAHLWQLPLTALTPEAPVDYGPPVSTAPRGYLPYDGSHYTGLAHDPDDPAVPAAWLLALPPEPGFWIPPDI